MADPSFVAVKRAFVDYQASGYPLQKMLGRQRTTHSVLRDVSFSLKQGEWVTLFGEAGAGKTTLLRMLAGVIVPSQGTVSVNGRASRGQRGLAAGYVSAEESEPATETVSQVLHAFGETHGVKSLPARIGSVVAVLAMEGILHRPANRLSTTERLRLNIARAALSDAPLLLLDDTADQLGVRAIAAGLQQLFAGRTAIVATRFPQTAEQLDLPILLLHGGTLAHHGTCDDIASSLGCPRAVDVWVEGLRYDVLRSLRGHPGVEEVRLLPTDQFDGQRLRIILTSSRYLPSVYDLVSQTAVVKIEELPASLAEVIARLHSQKR